MKKTGRNLYVLTIVSTLIALLIMVIYNFNSFYSNAVTNMNTIGTNALAQGREQLEGYLNKGMGVLQVTAISVEYMMENGATSEEIEAFLVR